MHVAQSLINHVVLVLDASWSMKKRKAALIKAADAQVKHLAQRSQELKQETRLTIYRFGSQTIECLIFDMDVMRVPSIATMYDVLYENTALIDATIKSQKDLETTSQLYGDHAFLTFVLTDGQENESKKYNSYDLTKQLQNMPDNWSMGWLVPNQTGVDYLAKFGVLRDSIAVWDANTDAGMDLAVSSIQTATDNFMTARAKGVRGTRSVFSTGAEAVNARTVSQNLEPISKSKYGIYKVMTDGRIDETTRAITGSYKKGQSYYQLTKTEEIQPQKDVIVVDRATSQAYGGDHARDLLGLPGKAFRARPNYNPKYDIFVQSTSINRKLLAGTNLLIMY
jgi:hypothetical protein